MVVDPRCVGMNECTVNLRGEHIHSNFHSCASYFAPSLDPTWRCLSEEPSQYIGIEPPYTHSKIIRPPTRTAPLIYAPQGALPHLACHGQGPVHQVQLVLPRKEAAMQRAAIQPRGYARQAPLFCGGGAQLDQPGLEGLLQEGAGLRVGWFGVCVCVCAG